MLVWVYLVHRASESINAMLKRKVNYKKSELVTFIQHLKELVNEQQRELE